MIPRTIPGALYFKFTGKELFGPLVEPGTDDILNGGE